MPAHIHIAPTAYGVVAARFGVARSEPAPAATAHPLVLLPGSPVSTEHLPRPEVVTLGLYGNPRRRPPTYTPFTPYASICPFGGGGLGAVRRLPLHLSLRPQEG